MGLLKPTHPLHDALKTELLTSFESPFYAYYLTWYPVYEDLPEVVYQTYLEGALLRSTIQLLMANGYKDTLVITYAYDLDLYKGGDYILGYSLEDRKDKEDMRELLTMIRKHSITKDDNETSLMEKVKGLKTWEEKYIDALYASADNGLLPHLVKLA